jgi:flagellar motor switch protein FliM
VTTLPATATATSDAAPHRADVDVYDFRRPTTLAREHSRVLEVAFETFARQWGTQLTANTRTRCLVSFRQVVMLSYNEYAASLPAATTMVGGVAGGAAVSGHGGHVVDQPHARRRRQPR